MQHLLLQLCGFGPARNCGGENGLAIISGGEESLEGDHVALLLSWMRAMKKARQDLGASLLRL